MGFELIFTQDRNALDLIDLVVERAYATPVLMEYFRGRARGLVIMDISATNARCPLRLMELLNSADEDFVHDICGIYRHLNRKTGLLEDCFLPRCAR